MNQRKTIHAYSLNDSQTSLLCGLLDDYLDKLRHNEILPDLFEFAEDTAGEIAGAENLKSLLGTTPAEPTIAGFELEDGSTAYYEI